MEPIDIRAGETVSWVGFAFNTLMFSAQLPLMRAMLRDKDAASRSRYSFWPALGQFATTCFWLGYAICVLPAPSIIAINSLGIGLALVYCGVFIACRPSAREKLVVAGAFAVVAAAAALLYALAFGLRYSNARLVASIVTIIVNVSLWATPLQALRLSALERSLQRVSVPLTLCQAGAATSWTAAGFLLGDITLVITSMCGVVLTPIQLAVIAWIWAKQQGGGGQSAAAAAATGAAASRPAAPTDDGKGALALDVEVDSSSSVSSVTALSRDGSTASLVAAAEPEGA